MAYWVAITSSSSEYMTLVNADTGLRYPFDLANLSQIREAAFSPDGAKVAYIGNSTPYLVVQDLSTGATTTITGGAPTSASNGVAWSPNGALLAVAHDNSPYLTVYNTSTWAKVTLTGGNPAGPGSRLAFSPNGALLAIGHMNSPYMTVYDTSSWAKVTLTGGAPTGNFINLRFNPAGTQLAYIGSTEPYLTVYDTATWNKLTISGGSPTSPTSNSALAYNLTGTELYVGGGYNPYLTVYNASTWAKITSNIPTLSNPPTAIAYDSRGQYVLYGFSTGTPSIEAYSLTGTVVSPVWLAGLRTLSQPPNRTITSIAFGASPRYLRGTVRDVSGNPVARTVRAHLRSTGQFCGSTVSDSTTGDYELKLYEGDVDYDIQFMISPGETLNDLFFARTTTSSS